MRSLLDNFSSFDDVGSMGWTHRTQSMRDDEHRAPLTDLRHVLLNHRLGFIVQCTRGLIKN